MARVTVPFQLGPGGKSVPVRITLDEPPDVPPPPPPPMPPDVPLPEVSGPILRRVLAHGMSVEAAEHPQLPASAVRQLVLDHLRENPRYYSKPMAAPDVGVFVGALLRRAYVGQIDPGPPDPDTVPPPSKPGYGPDIWGRGGDPALRESQPEERTAMGEIANLLAMGAVFVVGALVFGGTLRPVRRRR